MPILVEIRQIMKLRFYLLQKPITPIELISERAQEAHHIHDLQRWEPSYERDRPNALLGHPLQFVGQAYKDAPNWGSHLKTSDKSLSNAGAAGVIF